MMRSKVINKGALKGLLEMPHETYWLLTIESVRVCANLHSDLKRKEFSKVDQGELAMRRRKALIDPVLFAGLTLDSYINYYFKLNEVEALNISTPLTVLDKWRIYPQLTVGKNMDRDSIKCAEYVVGLRDQLSVPFQEKIRLPGLPNPEVSGSIQGKIELLDQKDLLDKVRVVIKGLSKIDPAVASDLDWLV